MSSLLNITTQLSTDNLWEVTATISPEGTLPPDIFIYENFGGTTLGKYAGVCSVDQYQRFQTFSGASIPVFGNRYVKYNQAVSIVLNQNLVNQVIACITQDVLALSVALSNQVPVTITVSIP